MKKHNPTAKQRELSESFDKLKKDHSKPALDANKYGKKPNGLKLRIPRASDALAKVRDRIPKEKSVTVLAPIESKKSLQPMMSQEEYARREKVAREVKHCIMPLHKGNYIVVTDEEMIKQMGKKTA